MYMYMYMYIPYRGIEISSTGVKFLKFVQVKKLNVENLTVKNFY